MFGTVTIDQPEMRFKDFYLYRSYYCGICIDLKRKYGNTARMSLGYDVTFLALLLSGLYEPETDVHTDKCLPHPFVPREKRNNEFTEYAADMNVLLAYYKCMDDWKDERKLHRFLFGKLIGPAAKKAAGEADCCIDRYRECVQGREAYRPEDILPDGISDNSVAVVMSECLDKLSEAEKDMTFADHPEDGIIGNEMTEILIRADRMAGYFGRITEAIFAYRQDRWTGYLKRMGFGLGKFIYISDAFEDIEKDTEKNCFNPFKDIYARSDEAGRDELEKRIEEMLRMYMGEVSQAFEMLPVVENGEILRNIIYSGIWRNFRQAQKRREDIASAGKGTGND